jgi:hypothetical protein
LKAKLAFSVLCAVVAAAFVAPSAQAVTHKLFVTPLLGYADDCRVSTDQVKWSYTFKAKIKRKNSPLPKRVTIDYAVTDVDTGLVVVEQTLVLKPKKFFKIGALSQYTAGHNLSVRVKASFKSPLTGKRLKSDSTLADAVPTVAMMDAANPPLPACAV